MSRTNALYKEAIASMDADTRKVLDEKWEKEKRRIEMEFIDSPRFLDFMWNAIDNSPELSNVKVIIQRVHPNWIPFVNDEVIDRSARLYLLSKKLEYVVGRSKTGKIHFKRWEHPRQFEKKIEKNLDSKDGHKQTMERTIVKALFNGTSLDFPANFPTGEYLTPVEIMEKVDEQIEKNYKNISSSKLDTIFRKVAEMESQLSKLSKKGDSNFHVNVADEYEMTKEQFAFNWFCMIRMLLMNGRIKDDLNFGFVVIGPKGLDKMVALAFFNGTCVTYPIQTTRKELMARLDEAITCDIDVEECYEAMVEIEDTICEITMGGPVEFDTMKKVAEILEMDEDELVFGWFLNLRYLLEIGRIEDNDFFGFVFMTEEHMDRQNKKMKQEQETAEQIERELAEKEDHAEYLRLLLEKEVEEQQRKIELAKAEEKRKAEEVKAKAKAKSKEASKRNIPAFPPNMKERGKKDSTKVCNKKAQLDWLKKHVPNWDGTLWNKKQADKYIDDIKKGIDVIVCDRVPVAEACGVCNDDFEGLVHAEASNIDAYNL